MQAFSASIQLWDMRLQTTTIYEGHDIRTCTVSDEQLRDSVDNGVVRVRSDGRFRSVSLQPHSCPCEMLRFPKEK